MKDYDGRELPQSKPNPTSRHLTPESGHDTDWVQFNDFHGRQAQPVIYGGEDEDPHVPERTGLCRPIDQLMR